MTGCVDRDFAMGDGRRWTVAWASGLIAFTLRREGAAGALAFDELDEIETAIGGPIPWPVRARLETDRHQSLEEQAEHGCVARRGGPGSATAVLRRRAVSRASRTRGRPRR